MNFILGFAICLSSCLKKGQDELISALPFGDSERERLYSIKNASSRLSSLSALVALDELLKAMGCKHGDLTVARDSRRKPLFVSLPLFFSLSHVEGVALAALSDFPIGIDIEWIDKERDIDGISGRFFTADESKEISDASDRTAAFFSLWTKKEAYAKLTGDGLISVCSTKDTGGNLFTQYLFELDGRKAIISICHPNDESIYIHAPESGLTYTIRKSGEENEFQ